MNAPHSPSFARRVLAYAAVNLDRYIALSALATAASYRISPVLAVLAALALGASMHLFDAVCMQRRYRHYRTFNCQRRGYFRSATQFTFALILAGIILPALIAGTPGLWISAAALTGTVVCFKWLYLSNGKLIHDYRDLKAGVSWEDEIGSGTMRSGSTSMTPPA